MERVLGITTEQFAAWPESVRDLAGMLSEEFFLVRYNPFINPETVYANVLSRLRQARPSLSPEVDQDLTRRIKSFWNSFVQDQHFRDELVQKLRKKLHKESIDIQPNTLVECSTDATDLRMALPMMVVAPTSTEEIQFLVQLANDMGFALVPRGGGSGLTGGAIPTAYRTVVLSLSRLKRILDVDPENMTICAEAGVITLNAIQAAAEQGLLFTVDPASKAASSIGGNISENSGGPFAFEYGTTIDNILSFRMVTPLGEVIEVVRRDHPRHKILPDEIAVFEIRDESGAVKDVVELHGGQIRGEGLGKDVTNKFLGGLPGVQKEGVDGIITEACFVCYPTPSLSRTLCLEFFGRSMINAMYVIKDLIALRDTIRDMGDLVKMSALEEFGIKYVRAIEYVKKSSQYEGEPNSVLLVQLDSDSSEALDDAVQRILDICEPYDNVDVFAARDDKEAEFFWEDRHKLSAISKRTSGFKINEDIVIPTDVIPEFSDFLEGLNLHYAALAYRTALQEVGRLQGVDVYDKFINVEFNFATQILQDKVTTEDLNDTELELQAFYFFKDLKSRYPDLARKLDEIHKRMQDTRIVVANHMHAGDGNCHVNLPVDSNNPDMMALAHEAAEKVFTKVMELDGVVSGEHGIGITKINFLPEDKMQALREYKQQVDPNQVLNPGKLTRRKLPLIPYTFSFNRLIQDIKRSGLPDKDRLITLLQNIQVCTRCGKCKQVCAMYYPEQSLLFHPRNKNISLGALIEAIYYNQVNKGEPDKKLLAELRRLMEHCTACGKCAAVCPVKIDTPRVTLFLRTFLEDYESGGHPVKHKVLSYLAKDPAKRVPKAAKYASLGQSFQNKLLKLAPAVWRKRMASPLFSGPGPVTEYTSLAEHLNLKQGGSFLPEDGAPYLDEDQTIQEAVYYFPGCGAGLFYPAIGLAGLMLLLRAGVAVIMPKEHLCCGYPLLASGSEEAFTTNQARNIYAIKKQIEDAQVEGIRATTILTSCGTCRDGLQRYDMDTLVGGKLKHMDVVQFLLERGPGFSIPGPEKLLYHGSCHAEWTGVHKAKAAGQYRSALANITGSDVTLSPGCCGESGMGALTSPKIYNRLRARKQEQLSKDLLHAGDQAPLLVGCPSCKIGISRSIMAMKRETSVLHTLEFLAASLYGEGWREQFVAKLEPSSKAGPRVVFRNLYQEKESALVD